MNLRTILRSANKWRTLNVSNLCSTMSVRPSSSGSLDEEKLSINIAGQNLKYVRRGNGEHVVLCIPGGLGSAWTDFRPQIEGLDKNEFTVIAWDPPGFGHSRPPNRVFTPGFFKKDADTAHAFMEALNLPKFSLLGWSYGGITSMILAANYPNSVRKLAVWGVNCYVTDKQAKIYERLRDVTTWPELARAAMVELYGLEYLRTLWSMWTDAMLHIYNEERGNICKDEVKKIRCPLLLLHGDKDPVVDDEHPKYILAAVPGSQFYAFKEGKHNIHLRYPKEFNSIVENFLKSSKSTVSSHM